MKEKFDFYGITFGLIKQHYPDKQKIKRSEALLTIMDFRLNRRKATRVLNDLEGLGLIKQTKAYLEVR